MVHYQKKIFLHRNFPGGSIFLLEGLCFACKVNLKIWFKIQPIPACTELGPAPACFKFFFLKNAVREMLPARLVRVVIEVLTLLTVSCTEEKWDALMETYNARDGVLKNHIIMNAALRGQKTFAGILMVKKVPGVTLWMRIKDTTFVLWEDALIVTQVTFLSNNKEDSF